MNTLYCHSDLNGHLFFYLENNLNALEHVAVEKHIKECHCCSREYELMRSIAGQLHRDPGVLRTMEGFGACIPSAMLVNLVSGKKVTAELLCACKRHLQQCESCRIEFTLLNRLQAARVDAQGVLPVVGVEAFFSVAERYFKNRGKEKFFKASTTLVSGRVYTASRWVLKMFRKGFGYTAACRALPTLRKQRGSVDLSLLGRLYLLLKKR